MHSSKTCHRTDKAKLNIDIGIYQAGVVKPWNRKTNNHSYNMCNITLYWSGNKEENATKPACTRERTCWHRWTKPAGIRGQNLPPKGDRTCWHQGTKPVGTRGQNPLALGDRTCQHWGTEPASTGVQNLPALGYRTCRHWGTEPAGTKEQNLPALRDRILI